jgi:hypothetical protein
MTVTATQGGVTANGMILRVQVLTGAAAAAAQTGGTGAQSASGGAAHQASVTTTVAGSYVYGAMVNAAAGTTWTAAAGVTIVDTVNDATNGEFYGSCRTTTGTGTPGATTVGASAPTNGGGFAGAEILPAVSGTPPAEDASGPALASTLAATAVTTASFTPPAGSLLVAMIASDAGSGVETMALTDTSGLGLTWVALAQAHVSSADYAGVWIAQVPAAAGFVSPQPGGPVWRRRHRRRQTPVRQPPGFEGWGVPL